MIMAEISNEALAVLMVAVIVVVIGSVVSLTWMDIPDITGRATDTGTAQVNVTELVSISLDVSSIDFGDGYVNTTCGTTAILNTTSTGNVECGTFPGTGTDFIVNNTGNVPINLTVSAGADAAGLIGGTSPAYQGRAQDNTESGSCAGTLTSSWQSLSTTAVNLCDNLSYSASADALDTEIQMKIPEDSTKGVLSDTLTFEGLKSGA